MLTPRFVRRGPAVYGGVVAFWRFSQSSVKVAVGVTRNGGIALAGQTARIIESETSAGVFGFIRSVSPITLTCQIGGARSGLCASQILKPRKGVIKYAPGVDFIIARSERGDGWCQA